MANLREEDDWSIAKQLTRLYGDEEVFAGSSKTTKFTLQDVKMASSRIAATTITADLRAWREEDNTDKKPGGRPRTMDDWHILVGCMLLISEHSPLWAKELRNIFWYRLTPEARTFLGLDDIVVTGKPHNQGRSWYNRVWRCWHRLLDVIDPYPAPRRLMNLREREYVMSLRDRNTSRLKRARLDRFSNNMLEMTLMMVPRATRRKWKGSISVDQTDIQAPSPHGTARPIKGEPERDAVVLEIDAGWHTREPDKRGKDAYATAKLSMWAYEANIAVQVAEDPYKRAEYPLLAVGFTLSKPNKDIGGEIVTIARSLTDRGYPAGRLTGDKAYFANLKPEHLAFPVRALGYKPVTDYVKNRVGIQGGQHGALLVDGTYLCPSTPAPLIEVTATYPRVVPERDYDTEAVRDKMIAERQHYRLRQKEKEDEHGSMKMMCPAYGPGATVTCPLRDIHPNSSAKDKPHVFDPPEHPDHICTQTSVTFELTDADRYRQHLPYQSPEWQKTYAVDRNTIEGFNAYLEDSGREDIDNTANRRLRGLAAQQFIVTMLIVSANIRKVLAFIRDDHKPDKQKTTRRTRRRNHNSLKNYVTRIAAVRAVEGLPPLKPHPRK